jgi:ABC-type transport system substrate-binding protein
MYSSAATFWRQPKTVLAAGVALACVLVSDATGAAAQVERVVLALNTPNPETNRSWAGAGSSHVQLEPFLESLLANDHLTGEAIPGLAERWEVSDDFREWRFFLREGVPFHFGFGEFTAADVAHTHRMITQEESVSFLKGLWSTAEVEVVNDHEVVFRFADPMLEGERIFSRRAGDFLIYSKAQYDAEGVEGIDLRPAGTGIYQYKERSPGEGVIYEHFPEHWSGVTPDFKEMEFRWAPENATRLAMLLAGEAHIADISRDLQAQAEDAGMKVVGAGNPNQQTLVWIGGQFHRAGDPEQDPPWLSDVRVRQALNKAINREEVIEHIYGGRGTLVYRLGFHPDHEGWNPEWEERFEEM